MPTSAPAQAANPVAAMRSRTRNGSTHQSSVSAGSTSASASRTFPSRSGLIASRKPTVSLLMITTSRKLAVIRMISYLSHDSRISGTTQHRKPEEVEQAPGEAERDLRHDADFAPEHEAECRQVQRRQEQNSQGAARGG